MEEKKTCAEYQGRTAVTYVDAKDGRLYVNTGYARRIYWSRDMLDYLKRHFATSRNDELSGELGVSQRTMIRKARELGLQKGNNYLRQLYAEKLFLAHSRARQLGYPGCFKKGEPRRPRQVQT